MCAVRIALQASFTSCLLYILLALHPAHLHLKTMRCLTAARDLLLEADGCQEPCAMHCVKLAKKLPLQVSTSRINIKEVHFRLQVLR